MACQVADHLEPWQDLEDKVVLVTGASSGLGSEFCLNLAKAGCKIVAAARRVDRLKSLCDEINNLTHSNLPPNADRPVRAVVVELDVTSGGSSISASVQKAWEAFGRIDVLLNNAGIRGNVNSPLDTSEEEWNNNLKTNLTGSWLVSKYVGMRMRDAKNGGSIINISSIVSLNRGQSPGAVAYVSSKSGLSAMTKVLALELGAYNIRANAIAPGIFKSEITAGLMQKDWLNTVVQRTCPLGTYGTSDPALTSLVRYLIHDSSRYISGNVFIVDAGATLPGVPIFSSL
ncbi:3-oxoacyl-[acyl-carrier-protein] reductase FabG-like [Vitis riparia]|uniref:3-oxoacyl-[acyl-carrier-protein] reductase FabG-like n=1 Tax=Vitis riparia TaxID=96939 RepID=UPI00155AEEFA|nr:3-oxoacyl-[acyl-carrier-protein] reductase FabG-like [Vitis riparia]